MPTLLADDLDRVLETTRPLWEQLRGERVFLTGGTGFFGCWLLESFLWANTRLGLNAEITVLTRHPGDFEKKAPHLALHPAVTLHRGDVRVFAFPAGSYSYLIHAATDSNAALQQSHPLLTFDSIIEGTRRALEFASASRCGKLLLTSSGAVYGQQPGGLRQLPETYNGAPQPNNPGAAYAEGKRAAEFLAAASGLHVAIARCFAFIGPYLPLHTNFAAGNFIASALEQSPIRVKGDGTTYRSYLYASDLVAWLWTILFRGAPLRPYNVGSKQEITIAELARMTAHAVTPHLEVTIAQQPLAGSTPQRYVPCTERATTELGLSQSVCLEEAIARTIRWHKLRAGQGV